MIGSTAALTSLAESFALLAELASARMEAKRVEWCAEALGRQVAATERKRAFPREGPYAPTVYVGLDCTYPPVYSSEMARRIGKQPDGAPVRGV